MISIGCKKCTCTRAIENSRTPRGHIQQVLCSARKNTRRRINSVTKQARTCDFDIDYDFVVGLYKEQRGRCAYSGVPITFGGHKQNDWNTSLERIDPLKGYTKDNVCLIACEFNAGDATSQSVEEVTGSCGWSKEKFEYFKQVYMEYKKKMNT